MLVSICLPTYNGSQFIEGAVASVQRQTYQNFELLICDDASDDGTYELIQRSAKDDNKIICWRNNERAGLFRNYNMCLARAKGDLIKPFAQDDLLDASALERMVAAFQSAPQVVLVCADKHNPQSYAADVADRVEESLPEGHCAGREAIDRCLRSYRNLIGEPVSVLFDARFKDLGFDSQYHSLGDLHYWLRILAHGDLFHIAQPLVAFREHSGSTTTSLLKNMDWVLDFYRLSHEYKADIERLGIDHAHYCMRFTELAGTLIEKLERSGKLEICELDGFREVAYFSMKRCAELAFKSREYDAIVASTSWKITAPLRSFIRRFGNKS